MTARVIGVGPEGLETARSRLSEDGHCRLPRLYDDEEIAEAVAAMDRVLVGEHRTGRSPHRRLPEGTALGGFVKVDQPHRCDDAIRRIVESPRLGAAAAALVGAQRLQVFSVQLLYKGPGRADAAVDWHQDHHFWRMWFEGPAYTFWIALSDVTEQAGALRYVRGSHRWGHLAGSDFIAPDMPSIRAQLGLGEDVRWVEDVGTVGPGEVAVHDRMTIHSSGPNESSGPRRSIAVHVVTERARRVLDVSPFTDVHDLDECPVIWDHGSVAP